MTKVNYEFQCFVRDRERACRCQLRAQHDALGDLMHISPGRQGFTATPQPEGSAWT